MTPDPEFDPTAEYIAIVNRLRECQAMGEKMPAAESARNFAILVHCCQSLIATNERLRQAVNISDAIVSELEIELCLKDIEIFNFTNHSQEKDADTP